MISSKMQIHGLQQIRQNMQELPRKVDVKILNEGLVKGARLVRDEAKAHVPLLRQPDARRIRGAIRRAIVAGRVRPEGYAAKVWVRVRPLTKRQIKSFKVKAAAAGKRWSGAFNPNDPFYWSFLEFGTSKMAARPFMRPAFESRKEIAVKTAIDVFRVRVQAEIDKLGRRGVFA